MGSESTRPMTEPMTTIQVVVANYHKPQHQHDIPYLLNAYANDPMGGGNALPEDVQSSLVAKLAKLAHAFSVIAYVDDEPAGLVNCFEAFSTFKAKPLVNIHDVVVLKAYRGLGISQRLLAEVERIATDKGCCKITLEVLSGNTVAINAYKKYGFDHYQLDPTAGVAQFWEKALPTP